MSPADHQIINQAVDEKVKEVREVLVKQTKTGLKVHLTWGTLTMLLAALGLMPDGVRQAVGLAPDPKPTEEIQATLYELKTEVKELRFKVELLLNHSGLLSAHPQPRKTPRS